MIDHDKNVGQLLAMPDELGIANDTIVFYSIDNGPHENSWPDAATTPFRNENNTNWEGAFRVPAMVRWPGHIKAGSVSNKVVRHMDWLPTIMAAAGDPDINDELLKGYQVGKKTFKVHPFFLRHFIEGTGNHNLGAPRNFCMCHQERRQ